jgi:beta-galactosidase
MKTFSRRDMLKTSLLAPAAVAANGLPLSATVEAAGEETHPQVANASPSSLLPGAGRERQLLDFGWRFHLGHASDPAKDFSYGLGRTGTYQKTGNFLPAGNLAFDDGDWKAVDLPHDWAIELPFQNDPALNSKGYYPLGRNYPATGGYSRSPKTMPANASRLSSTAHTAKQWSSSMVTTSPCTAAATIPSR